MQCKVEGCGRDARYKADCLCQRHYFRVRRNGSVELARKAKPRIEDDRGYQFLHAPTHPLLAKGQIYVAEHRIVLYAAIGPGPMACALCQCSLTWKTCNVDHIDENPRNNALDNLRPTCRRCNTWRSMPPAVECRPKSIAITFDGETKTAHEWGRDPRVCVHGKTIRDRKKKGASDFEALFGEKKTHNGRTPKKREYRAKVKQLKREAAL